MTMKSAAFTRNSARHAFNSDGEMAARSGSFSDRADAPTLGEKACATPRCSRAHIAATRD